MTVSSPSAPRPLTKSLSRLLAYGVLAHLLYGLLRPAAPPLPPGAPAAAETNLTALMADLVEPHGYPLEEHFVTTSDGYILRLFRIPHGAGRAAAQPANGSCSAAAGPEPASGGIPSIATATARAGGAGRPAALLQHALMDSSAGWVLLGPGRGLAFQLADAGFDVWLANSRGNRYSRNHTRLDPDADPAFWSWSWADMAERDVPAMAGHVVAATGQEKLVYFGYSQGSMIGLAALASQPSLAPRVSLAVLLVPVAFTAHMTSLPFVLLSRLGLDRAAAAAGFGEWGAHTPHTARRAARVCGAAPALCAMYLTVVCGANPNGNLDTDVLTRLMAHMPLGTSVANMAHWSQGIRRRSAGGLLRFDHGSDCSGGRACNRQVYGADAPTAYNLSTITTPLALFTGDRDAIAPPADVALLKAALAPGVLAAHHAEPDYGHLDYEVGADAAARVYPRIVALALSAAAGGLSAAPAAA